MYLFRKCSITFIAEQDVQTLDIQFRYFYVQFKILIVYYDITCLKTVGVYPVAFLNILVKCCGYWNPSA